MWTVNEVTGWVNSLKFPASNVALFRDAQVDGDILLQITEKNLKDDLSMTNGIHRKRFMRELNNLRKQADYSSVDSSNIAKFLERNVGSEYRIYAYNLIKCDLSLDLMKRLNESDLNDMLIEADISSSIHRRKIIDSVLEDGIVMYLEGPRRDPVSHELDTRQVGSVEELYDRQQQFFLENQKKRLD